MKTMLSLALLVGGVILLYFGITSSNSLSSEISKFFTSSPTNQAIWMLLIGAVLAIVGVVGLFTTSTQKALY